MRTRNIITMFFYIFTAICAITFLTAVILGIKYLLPTSGNVLTEDFIRAYAGHKNTLICLIYTFLALVFAIIDTIIIKKWDSIESDSGSYDLKETLTRYALFVAVVALTIYLFSYGMKRMYLQTTFRSQAVAVVLSDKYTRERRIDGDGPTTYYYYLFSNDMEIRVSQDRYFEYRTEHKFYLIMFNNECMGYLDADVYSLPQE